jgi:hypothetical protein
MHDRRSLPHDVLRLRSRDTAALLAFPGGLGVYSETWRRSVERGAGPDGALLI